MDQDIQSVEYRGGFLRPGVQPDDLAVQKWSGDEIPPEARKAIVQEGLLGLGGTYGERAAAEPVEYDHLRIIFAGGSTDIHVFGRRELLSIDDADFKQIHRAICKLNKALMAVPEIFTSEQRAGTDPRLPLPPGGKFTYRDQANVLALLAFRNGPIEDLHAGRDSHLPEDPGLSRITDEEMKALMIAAPGSPDSSAAASGCT